MYILTSRVEILIDVDEMSNYRGKRILCLTDYSLQSRYVCMYGVSIRSYVSGHKAQGHSRTYPNSEDVGGDTMMSHFVRGRSNAIDWLKFRNLLVSYLRVRHELESLEQVSTNQVMNKYPYVIVSF